MAAPEPVTVVGNGISGWACATRLAERGVPVRMIGPGLPHDRPPLSKRALERGSVPYLADRVAIAERGIVHLDGVVDRVDMARRALWARPSGSGGALELRFGPLVWATGLRIRRPPVPGGEQTLQNASAADMEALLPRIEREGRRVAVIGAGLIGSETAATLARRHRVTLIERADRPLERFPEPIGHAASRALADAGVRVLAPCTVERIEHGPKGAAAVVHTGEHGPLPFDVVIGATGVATTLLPGVGAEGEPVLDTDATLAVLGRDRLWACGDLARYPHPRHGRIAIPHWDHARASGAHVADAILGSLEPYVREPYWFSDVGRLRIQQVGLAAAACEWRLEDGLHVGRDADGRAACVVLLDLPSRLKDARGLVAA